MKIWMSGEIQSDIGVSYRNARRRIEESFNQHFASKTFGDGLSGITYIGIIKNIDSPDFEEIQKYKKRDRGAEFRLKVPHNIFSAASEEVKIKLVAESVRRAVELLAGLAIPNFDYASFEDEFVSLWKKEGWF